MVGRERMGGWPIEPQAGPVESEAPALDHRGPVWFYRTQYVPRVGDMFPSLIHLEERNKDNPYDPLMALQRNHTLMEGNPEEWMPRNLL